MQNIKRKMILVFDGDPREGTGARFVTAIDDDGIKVEVGEFGEWNHRGGTWALTITTLPAVFTDCEECSGRGRDWDDWDCETCEGAGRVPLTTST